MGCSDNNALLSFSSAFGITLLNAELLREIRYANNKEFEKLFNSHRFQSYTDLSGGNKKFELLEVELKKDTVTITKPTQIGCAILANSKIQVLRFIHFLNRYLRDSAWEILASDTDSGKLLIQNSSLSH